MNHDQHRGRHRELHRALDELINDFVTANPGHGSYIEMPMRKLIEWSSQQCEKLTHSPHVSEL